MMGHLNSFSASGVGNLNKNFQKFKCPGVSPGGMFNIRFDWYITLWLLYINFTYCNSTRVHYEEGEKNKKINPICKTFIFKEISSRHVCSFL